MHLKPPSIKNILLLNPFSYEAEGYNVGIDPVVLRHAGQEIKTGVTFPIGLAYMAACLKNAGFNVKLLDPIAEKIAIEKIHNAAKWADAIILPFSPRHEESTQKFMLTFKHKLRVLCGGVSNYIYGRLFEKDLADVILNGEPEETVVELMQQYPNLNSVLGIIYQNSNRKTTINQKRPPINNLDAIPFPLRDFIDPKKYWDISFYGRPTAWILPTRGCPYDCIFCAQHEHFRKTIRRRSPKNIVDEIEKIVKELKVKNFVFFDETFNLDRTYTLSICDEILNRDLQIKWWCAARPDLVREDVAREMKKSGCIEMRFGLESANDEVLNYLRKNTSVQKIRAGIEITKKVGINFSLQCIFGSPMESEQTIKNTMKFIREVKPIFVSFNILTPLPGSQLFDNLKDKLNLEKGLVNFDLLHTDYPLGKYSSLELASIIRKAYINYYLSFSFFTRIIKEFFKNPLLCFWILKTLIKQGFYVYKSVVKK